MDAARPHDAALDSGADAADGTVVGLDAQVVDARVVDAHVVDAGVVDAGIDAGPDSDAGAPDADLPSDAGHLGDSGAPGSVTFEVLSDPVFRPAVCSPSSIPRAGASAHYDGDGRADYVVAGCGEILFVSDLTGSAPAVTSLGAYSGTSRPSVQAGDFDGDGCADFHVQQQIRFGDCAGAFSAPVSVSGPAGLQGLLLASNLDGNPGDELVFATISSASPLELFTVGAGRTVAPWLTIPSSEVMPAPIGASSGQWSSDGRPDLVVWTGAEVALLESTAGSFVRVPWSAGGSFGRVKGALILNDPDATLIVGSEGTFYPYPSSVSGFTPGIDSVPATAWTSPRASSFPHMGDLDGDGIPDFVTTSPGYTVYGFNGSRLGMPGDSSILASCPAGICDSLRGVPRIIDVESDGDADLLLTITSGTVGVTPIGDVYLIRQDRATP